MDVTHNSSLNDADIDQQRGAILREMDELEMNNQEVSECCGVVIKVVEIKSHFQCLCEQRLQIFMSFTFLCFKTFLEFYKFGLIDSSTNCAAYNISTQFALF